jgi:hypothetical protein
MSRLHEATYSASPRKVDVVRGAVGASDASRFLTFSVSLPGLMPARTFRAFSMSRADQRGLDRIVLANALLSLTASGSYVEQIVEQ